MVACRGSSRRLVQAHRDAARRVEIHPGHPGLGQSARLQHGQDDGRRLDFDEARRRRQTPGVRVDGPGDEGVVEVVPGRTIPPSRQSPAPAAIAYSKVWLQCWNWKFAPSGVDRRGGSIHTPDGQPLHERMIERYRLPSASTLKLGMP